MGQHSSLMGIPWEAYGSLIGAPVLATKSHGSTISPWESHGRRMRVPGRALYSTPMTLFLFFFRPICSLKPFSLSLLL